MLLNVPFYRNNGDGNECMQVAMKSTLRYFLNVDYPIAELDRLTQRKSGLWTWTAQAATVLHDLGLHVKYYSSMEIEPFLEGEPFIRRHFGNDADRILKFTDLPVVLAAIRNLLKYDIFQKEKLSIEKIEHHIEQGHLPLVLIDHNKIAGKSGPYQGHFVAVTGFDEHNIFYHESGPANPEKNKKASKQVFIDAMNANGTDNDVIVVFGKK